MLILDAEGRLLAVEGIARDVTENVAVQDEDRLSIEKPRGIPDCAGRAERLLLQCVVHRHPEGRSVAEVRPNPVREVVCGEGDLVKTFLRIGQAASGEEVS